MYPLESESSDSIVQISQVASAMGWENLLFFLLCLLALLLCSAFVSGSEVAFFSLSANDFKKIEKDPGRSAQRILELKERPREVLASILIANNLINISIVLLSDYILQSNLPQERFIAWALLIENPMQRMGWELESVVRVLEFLLTTLVVTFLLVLFGEIAPKLYANNNNLGLTRLMSGPLQFLTRILYPFSRILIGFSSSLEQQIEKRFTHLNFTSSNEIDMAIDLTALNNQQSETEVDILKRIVKFGNVTVKQIMRSRTDMVAVEFDTSFEDLLSLVRESGYSRLPVYEEDLDHLVGVLYVKDLIGHINKESSFYWQDLIRKEVMYVPESKKIRELLRDFQSSRVHMGIVVDEFGGTEGLVTLEDIMEEVIGDIQDEFDDEIEVEYRKLDPYNYIFEGKTLINDFCRILSLDPIVFDEIRGDADSIAGLMLQITGMLPKKNTEIKYHSFSFKIIKVSKRRIEEVQITIPKEI
jgi:putative hemolysin